MVRQTSAETYRQIQANGLLGRVRFMVYDLLYAQGPLTAAQVHSLLSKQHKYDHGGTYTSRLSELRNIGVVRELGTCKCPLTGRTVILWDVTDKLPIKFEKPVREKCKACEGRGYIESTQARFDF